MNRLSRLFFHNVLFVLALSLPAHAQPSQTLQLSWRGQNSEKLIKQINPKSKQIIMQYDEDMPLGKRVFVAHTTRSELKAIHANTLIMDIEIQGSETNCILEIKGYPNPDDYRRWYLNKLQLKKNIGKPQRIYLDLNIDDDTTLLKKEVDQVEIKLSTKLTEKGVTEPNPKLKLGLGKIQFISSDLQLTTPDNKYAWQVDDQNCTVTYRYNLYNSGKNTKNVKIKLDRQHLKHFKATLNTLTVTLKPDFDTTLIIKMTMDKTMLKTLPALYSERVGLSVIEEETNLILCEPKLGYSSLYLYAAVPPKAKDHPWFMPNISQKRKEKILQTSVGKSLIKKANERLGIDTTPPQLIHGHPTSHDPIYNKPLRFHGIGKVWSEGSKSYIDPTTYPIRYQRTIAYMHHCYLSSASLILAKTGWLTGDKKYSRKAADILMEYAHRYPKYPAGSTHSTAFQSRIGWAMLQESWWFDKLINATDMVFGADVLLPLEEKLIREDLMHTAAKIIRIHRIEANQQAEVNTSYGGAALLAKRYDIAAHAIDGPAGMRTQWATDFDEDGYSIERDQAYHFASLGPMVHFAGRLQALGMPIYDDTFKKLFTAPIARSIDGKIRMNRWVYENALSQWREPIFATITQHFSPSLESLIHGEPQNIETKNFPEISTLKDSGYTVLRQIKNDKIKLAATMNWGSPIYRGGKVLLSPEFFIQGQAINGRPSRIGYGYKDHPFSYTAASCNSLLVDGKAGSLIGAKHTATIKQDNITGGLWQRISRPGWKNINWSRAILLLDQLALTIDLVDAKDKHTFDFLWHTPPTSTGKQTGHPQSNSAYPQLDQQGDGYSYLKNPKINAQKRTSWNVDYPLKKGIKASFYGIGSPMQWITAQSMTGWHFKMTPLNIMRMENKKTAWLVTCYGAAIPNTKLKKYDLKQVPVTQLNGKQLPPQKAIALELQHKANRYLILITNSESKQTYKVNNHKLVGPIAIHKLSLSENF